MDVWTDVRSGRVEAMMEVDVSCWRIVCSEAQTGLP